MAFVRILPMNLLFCGPLRVFFGAPAGAVFGFLFCAAGGIVPAALMAPGAGALWLRRREDPDRNEGKRKGRQKCRSFCGRGETFRWGETARRAGRPLPRGGGRPRRSKTAGFGWAETPCGPNRRPARTVKSGFSPSAPALAEKVL